MISATLQAFFLLLMAAGAALLTQAMHPRAPALYLSEAPVRENEVNLSQIQERWQGDVIWVDARPNEVFEKGHIPAAHQLNEQQFPEQSLALMDVLQTTDKPVIIYCDGEKCDASHRIREKLMGIVALEHCYVLKGGYPVWQASQK